MLRVVIRKALIESYWNAELQNLIYNIPNLQIKKCYQKIHLRRGIFRILSKIIDGALFQNLFTAKKRQLFLQKVPSVMFDLVLYTFPHENLSYTPPSCSFLEYFWLDSYHGYVKYPKMCFYSTRFLIEWFSHNLYLKQLNWFFTDERLRE